MAAGFIFGADGLPKTPQELAQMREIAKAMRGTRNPRTVGEGLASLGEGIGAGIILRQANNAERKGREGASNAFSAIVNAMGGGGGSMPPATSSGEPGISYSGSIPTADMETDPINQRIANAAADGQAGNIAPTGDMSWLRYANEGATRNKPLSEDLVGALGFLPEMGVTMEVFSGGQDAKGKGHRRTGSTRHDHGNAADVYFYKDGKRLDWANEADRPVFEQIVKRGRAAGITGFGAGPGYMRPGSMHLGFGNEAVWGAGGSGANAPDWLRSAYASPATAGTQVASLNPIVPAPALPPSRPEDPIEDAKGRVRAAYTNRQESLPQAQQAAPQQQPKGVQRVAQAMPQGGMDQQTMQIIQAINNPYMPAGERAVLGAMLQQRQQANDPVRQMQLEKGRIELNNLKNPKPKIMQIDGQLVQVDANGNVKPIYASEGANTLQEQQIEKNNLEINQLKNPPTPESVRVLDERAQRAGLKPGTPEYNNFMTTGGGKGVSVNVNTSEGDKFYENLDKKNAETFAMLSEGGVTARSKLNQVDRLESLLAASPSGMEAGVKQMLGDFGINTEGLDNIQSTRALLEAMVPQQRPVGSGPMSDADVKMFRNSLPRLINQPGGNQLILQTMRGIAQYEMQLGEIADMVADRTIKPAEGRKRMRELQNPISSFRETMQGGNKSASGERTKVDPSNALDAARAAIEAGAPREAVINRLKEAGIDPSGL